MAPEVDEGAAGVVPEVAVAEVRTARIVGALWRGSEPELVIQLGRGRGVGRFAEALQAGADGAIDAVDAAERAGADELRRVRP